MNDAKPVAQHGGGVGVDDLPSAGARQGHLTALATRIGVGRLDKSSLVERISRQLREFILQGGFSADQPLPSEAEFARMFGVSRTVIREAIRSLRVQGLLEISQGRRPRVRPADPAMVIESLDALLQRGQGSLLDLVEVRKVLEAQIAALAAERATPEQLDLLEESIEQLASAPSLEAGVDADMLFHFRLADATGNLVFRLVLEGISGLLHESHKRTSAVSSVKLAIAGHGKILAAVQRRESTAAQVAMLEHLEEAERELREGIQR